jgi:hypothetical protein
MLMRNATITQSVRAQHAVATAEACILVGNQTVANDTVSHSKGSQWKHDELRTALGQAGC